MAQLQQDSSAEAHNTSIDPRLTAEPTIPYTNWDVSTLRQMIGRMDEEYTKVTGYLNLTQHDEFPFEDIIKTYVYLDDQFFNDFYKYALSWCHGRSTRPNCQQRIDVCILDRLKERIFEIGELSMKCEEHLGDLLVLKAVRGPPVRDYYKYVSITRGDQCMEDLFKKHKAFWAKEEEARKRDGVEEEAAGDKGIIKSG